MAITTTDFGAALDAAIHGGYVAHLTGQTYTITEPVVIHVTSTTQGALGIDGGGATLVSQVTSGEPLIRIVVDPGVDLRYLTLSNFTIAGNGREGDGIQIVCDTNESWVYNWTISNVTVAHVGGYGLDVQGSVFEGLVVDSWMNGNGLGGAYFAHSANGGMVSALRWLGGGAEDNGGAGITLGNEARDLSVSSATFAGNGGVGISAAAGITSVSGSTFADNHGSGIWFQNYGNFAGNSFSTSGAQTTGISGYLAGSATLIGNTSSHTGTDVPTLANLQGNGGVFLTGDSGAIVTGTGVAVSEPGGGSLANVTVSTQGLAFPTLSAVSAATTASVATSSGTSVVESALRVALAGGSTNHLADADSYTVSAAIVINVTSSTSGGIDLGGAKILSQITNGSPVVQINVAAGVSLSSLTLANFSILGNGAEGDGIRIVVDGVDRSIGLDIRNVDIEHVGGIGLDVIGNVSGTVFDSWMHGNARGGARFANSAGGGVASGLEWQDGGFRKNGVAGLILDNGAHDMAVQGAYFVDNDGPGLAATSGIGLVAQSGFENNAGAGAMIAGPATFVDDTFSTWGIQRAGVAGTLSGGRLVMTGDGSEYYGAGADPTQLVNLQGSGTLAVSGTGTIVVGPNIAVTGGQTSPTPTVTARLASDTGESANDGITAIAVLTGTADPDAVVRFAIDGSASPATATADAGGVWSLALGGLADGVHSVVAYQTNAAGATGSASLGFILDTSAPQPVFTGAVLADGKVTLSGTTGGAGDVLSIYDGYEWLGFATTGSDGTFSFVAAADPGKPHSYGANATDLAGNEGRTAEHYVVGAAAPTAALANDTGASSTDGITASAALVGTAEANAVIRFIIDGTAIANSVTADAKGAWSFTPSGLADGDHTVIISATGAAGVPLSTTLGFILDTHAPAPLFTGGTVADGRVSITGSGAGAGDVLSIYDGYTWLGFVTAASDGSFAYTGATATDAVHSFGANVTDLAGNDGKTANRLTLGSAAADVLVGSGGNEIIAGGGGADRLTAGPGRVTFAYNAASDSRTEAADTITDFTHGVDRIDFTAIAGIDAIGGVPRFQGQLTGSGNLTLAAHGVAWIEIAGNTDVLVNTSDVAETVSVSNIQAADMRIVLLGINLGLTANDFHHL